MRQGFDPKKNDYKLHELGDPLGNRFLKALVPVLVSTLLLFFTWRILAKASGINPQGPKQMALGGGIFQKQAVDTIASGHYTEIVLQPGPNDGIDTQINEAYPDKFYGDEAQLTIGFRSSFPDYLGGPYRILLKFDMSAVPTDRRIESALLEVYIQEFETGNSFNFYRATSDWDEATTWNTQPTYDSSRNWYIVDSDEGRTWVKRSVYVTEIFQAWQDGTFPNYGFYIKGNNETEDWTRQFMASSENSTTSMRPKVTILVPAPHTLSVSPEGSGDGMIGSIPSYLYCSTTGGTSCSTILDTGTVVTLTSKADPGSLFTGWEGACSGLDKYCTLTITESLHVIGKFSNVITDLVLQPGPEEGTDTYVDQANPTTSYGDEEILLIGKKPSFGGPGGPYRSLLKFDLSSIPTNVMILSAVLEAYVLDYERANTFIFYPATSSWDETTTWNSLPTYDSSQQWLSFYSDEGDTWVLRSQEFTEEFLGWLYGSYPNYGFYITGLVDDDRSRQHMASSDNPDEAMRPKLTVEIAAQFLLNTALGGEGEGGITSDPAGIDCSTTGADDCHEVLDYGAEITLTAVPEAGSVFSGWGGACSGTGECSLRVTEAIAVSATFEPGLTDYKVFIPLLIH